ncbi:MAG: hypothetical protein AB8Y71_03170, partial [Coxiella endosymbiont of Haemaphysalis qinghaiensis]
PKRVKSADKIDAEIIFFFAKTAPSISLNSTNGRRDRIFTHPMRFSNVFVSILHFLSLLDSRFYHFRRQLFRHQFIRIMLTHKAATGFFNFRIKAHGKF